MNYTQPDLFGGESRVIKVRASKKDLLNYRKAEGKENCSNCKRSFMVEGGNKNYRKCELIGNSASEATDVSRMCVCGRYENGRMLSE
jgi:hypothetical protein